jgi:hypothetical protein
VSARCTIGKANRRYEQEETPGPGKYETFDARQKRAPKYSIPLGKWTENPTNITPGPLDYQFQSFIGAGQSVSMTKQKRNDETQSNPMVGPGSYKLKSFMEGRLPGVSKFPKDLRRDASQKSLEDNPGPGRYNPRIYKDFDSLSSSGRGSIIRNRSMEHIKVR